MSGHTAQYTFSKWLPSTSGVRIIVLLLGGPVPLLLETATVTVYSVPSIRRGNTVNWGVRGRVGGGGERGL